ncbi:hypothetical protein JXA34_03635 [Patescibacteria group bacterium]|nr:hypothetical protein [Patescibacteria group bacterium]
MNFNKLSFKSSIFLVVLLVASMFVVRADPPENIERVDIPEGYEKDGSVCPPLLTGHITVCGQVSSARYYTEDIGSIEDIQFGSHPIEGVTIAVYLGGSRVGLRDPNQTGDIWGKLTGLYSYTVTNQDGEYAVPIPRGMGTSGYAFVAFLCGDGSNLRLADLYMIDTTLDSDHFDVSIGVGNRCHETMNEGIPAPPLLEYIDRGEPGVNDAGEVDLTVRGTPPIACSATGMGGYPGAEPGQGISAGLPIFRADLDDTYHTDYHSATGWIEGAAAYAATLPAGERVLSRRDLEGYTSNWVNYSLYPYSSVNCGLGGCYRTGSPSETNMAGIGCGQARDCSYTEDPEPNDGKDFPLPAKCRAPGLMLTSPWEWVEHLNHWYDVLRNIDGDMTICDGQDISSFARLVPGSIPYSNDDEGSIWMFTRNRAADFPLSLLMNPWHGRFLATTYKDRPSSDQYRNFDLTELSGITDCAANELEREWRRTIPTDTLELQADKPFKSCYKSKQPQDQTYSPQQSTVLATGNVDADRGFNPVVAAFAAPGEIIGQTRELQVDPAVNLDKIGRGYWRIGTEVTLCTGDSGDMEDGYLEPSDQVFAYDLDYPYEGGWSSGYKYSTQSTWDAWDEQFPSVSPYYADAGAEPHHGSIDTFKRGLIVEAMRIEPHSTDLWANFDIHQGNWNGNWTDCNEYRDIWRPSGCRRPGDDCGEYTITVCEPLEGSASCTGDCKIVGTQCCCPDKDNYGSCCEGWDCCTGADVTAGLCNANTCFDDPTEENPREYRYTCDGDVETNFRADLTIENAPNGDSTYGTWLATTMFDPPMANCSEDGVCFVGNAFTMDMDVEYDRYNLQSGWGLKVTGHGAPGEIYHLDRARKAVSMNFRTDGPEGDLNDSFIIVEEDGGTGKIDIACMAEAVGEFLAVFIEEASQHHLPHILIYTGAFNMTSPYIGQMISGAAAAAGPAWGMLDGVAGNIYNMHVSDPPVPITNILAGVRAIIGQTGVSSKPIFLSETGFYPPDRFLPLSNPDRGPALELLAQEIQALSSDSDFTGSAFFNAFNYNAMFAGHQLVRPSETDIVYSGCDAGCKRKTGVNSARPISTSEMYPEAAGLGMGFTVEILSNDTAHASAVAGQVTGANTGGPSLTPALRLGVGMNSYDFITNDSLVGEERWLHLSDNLINFLLSVEASIPSDITCGGPHNPEGCVIIMAGPNEPISEGWLAPWCGEGSAGEIPGGGDPGGGGTPVECPNGVCRKCDPSYYDGLSAIGGLGAEHASTPYTEVLDEVAIDAYAAGEEAWGVPCAILAGIHHVEGSNNPGVSVISGRAIGVEEPDRGGKKYTSLAETAVDAAEILVVEKGYGTPINEWSFQQLVRAISSYNGGGNSQIRGVGLNYPYRNFPCWGPEDPDGDGITCAETDCRTDPANECCQRAFIDSHGPFSTRTTGAPNDGTDINDDPISLGWLGMPEPYPRWSDLYPLSRYDADHAGNMALQYLSDDDHVLAGLDCGDPSPTLTVYSRAGVIPAAIWFHESGQLY